MAARRNVKIEHVQSVQQNLRAIEEDKSRAICKHKLISVQRVLNKDFYSNENSTKRSGIG